MTQTPVGIDIHQSFDIHLYFAARSPFDFKIRRYDGTDLRNLIVVEITDTFVQAYTRLRENFLGACSPYPVNVREADFRPLMFRQVNACYTCHDGVSFLKFL